MDDRNEHIHDENEPERGDEPTAERPADEPMEDVPSDRGAARGWRGADGRGPAGGARARGEGRPTRPDRRDEEPADEAATVEEPSAEEPTAEQPEAATRPRIRAVRRRRPGTRRRPSRSAAGAGAGAGGGAAGGGPGAAPPPRRLLRARQGRVLGGVCAGLGRYFNTDPVFFRIGAIVLTLIGGAGVLLYLAALLLIPKEDSVAQTAVDGDSVDGRSRGARDRGRRGVARHRVALSSWWRAHHLGAFSSHSPFWSRPVSLSGGSSPERDPAETRETSPGARRSGSGSSSSAGSWPSEERGPRPPEARRSSPRW